MRWRHSARESRLRRIEFAHRRNGWEIEKENEMAVKERRIRQNYMAIFTAAMICFVLEAIWYGVFMERWIAGVGSCSGWLMRTPSISPVRQYVTAVVAELVMAAAISCVTQLSGPQTVLRGIKAAVLLWLGFVATTWATQYGFELRPFNQLAINCGFWLLGMVVMGAIVGGWKKS
jgi:uncharacterized membrane protein YjjP (DUF1212 family)